MVNNWSDEARHPSSASVRSRRPKKARGHHFRINKTLATRTNIICNKQDASSSHFLTAGTLKLYPIMSFAFLDGL
jgi:hypothetical protein